jgi:hypothetical protein
MNGSTKKRKVQDVVVKTVATTATVTRTNRRCVVVKKIMCRDPPPPPPPPSPPSKQSQQMSSKKKKTDRGTNLIASKALFKRQDTKDEDRETNNYNDNSYDEDIQGSVKVAPCDVVAVAYTVVSTVVGGATSGDHDHHDNERQESTCNCVDPAVTLAGAATQRKQQPLLLPLEKPLQQQQEQEQSQEQQRQQQEDGNEKGTEYQPNKKRMTRIQLQVKNGNLMPFFSSPGAMDKLKRFQARVIHNIAYSKYDALEMAMRTSKSNHTEKDQFSSNKDSLWDDTVFEALDLISIPGTVENDLFNLAFAKQHMRLSYLVYDSANQTWIMELEICNSYMMQITRNGRRHIIPTSPKRPLATYCSGTVGGPTIDTMKASSHCCPLCSHSKYS